MNDLLLTALCGFILLFTFSLGTTVHQYTRAMQNWRRLGPKPIINFPVAFFLAFTRGMFGFVIAGAIGLILFHLR